jgi:preprotein translocase subunit SecY
MELSKTTTLLKKKFLKIFSFLILIRLGLYIPVPNLDLDIFTQNQITSPLFGLVKNLTGSSFLSIGSLGILPYINSSIIIQLLTLSVPSLERLQKEEGEFGRKQIKRYTRYLTFGCAIVLSTGIAFILIKPIVFNWNITLALQIIFSLTSGSMLSMWFAELITKENLGNGSAMIIFINIIGGLPEIINQNINLIIGVLLYFVIVAIIVFVQESYKRITIVSAKQLVFGEEHDDFYSETFSNAQSYIPIKLNQGGIMPLVFSNTVATFLFYPVQFIRSKCFAADLEELETIMSFLFLALNLGLVIFFSIFSALLILKPKDLSENLIKMSYNIPGLKQGKETTKYLKQLISRLGFMGGIFLASLAFFPFLKNLTSLIILVGVITDVTTQVKGYLVSQNYEVFKKL